MRNQYSAFLKAAAIASAVFFFAASAHAQIASNLPADVNTSQKAGDDNECAVAINNNTNPATLNTTKQQMFIACNTSTAGLFAARSTDRGVTWSYPDPADKTIADGNPGQGPQACCDPSLAWDNFGNLFLTYIDAADTNIVTLLSTDGGLTFNVLVQFNSPGVDQPTVVAGSGAVWVVWNQGGQMVARGAAVTGLGTVAAFNPLQTIPGTANCSFGDIAIAPSGAVVQACETPTGGQGPANILVNIDPDGLGPANFGPAITATTTNVGGFDFITPQNARSVDAEAGLAFDSNPASPHFGRLYLVYTEEPVDESNDTDIMLRFSDNNGANWSAPIRVNDDATNRAQFLPKIAANADSGNISICWHDARNSPTNTAMQVFCSTILRTDPAPVIQPNVQISDGASTSNASGVEFGDYAGLAYWRGVFMPAWADTSNSTANNPNGNANFDAYVDQASWLPLANEGDPHIVTADGTHYNFQSAGEFVALRDSTGLEIQTRQTPVATPGPWFDSYTGLSTCVSLNTAVAARVGSHRVTFEPNVSGVPDPSGMQLRIDGVVTAIPANGIDLGSGGRILKVGTNGIEIVFPDRTILLVTANWWASQSAWYLNVDVYRTAATDGIMGSLAKGSWLPALPNGTSLGPMPASANDRYTTLNQTYANAWRVSNASSLFDYGPGTSTATFTFADWPAQAGACVVPHHPPTKPMDPKRAAELCQAIADKRRKADCVFDVTATGEKGLADAYVLTQRIEAGATTIAISDNLGGLNAQTTKPVPIFIATVARLLASKEHAPSGSVQFMLDGERVGDPVRLDETGHAVWKAANLKPGKHKLSAMYTPGKESTFLPSSAEKIVALEGGAR